MERLIYTDANRNEIGYLSGFSLDLENGKDNDFKLTLPLSDFSKLSPGCLIYCENNLQYGGRIDEYNTVSASDIVNFKGRTWRGIFDQKILTSHVSYAATSILSDIMQHTINLSDFNDMFKPVKNTGTIGKAAQIGKYTSPLNALETIFKLIEYRPSFSYDPTSKKVKVSAVPIVDYSSNEFESNKVLLDININATPVNHVVAITKSGTEKHRYLLKDGTQSETVQDFKGSAEVMRYITVSSDDSTVVSTKMAEIIDASVQASQTCAVTVTSVEADVGDLVGGRDKTTAVYAVTKVTSKVLKMDKLTTIVNLETGV